MIDSVVQCDNCGSKLSNDDTFCGECGQKIIVSNINPKNNEASELKSASIQETNSNSHKSAKWSVLYLNLLLPLFATGLLLNFYYILLPDGLLGNDPSEVEDLLIVSMGVILFTPLITQVLLPRILQTRSKLRSLLGASLVTGIIHVLIASKLYDYYVTTYNTWEGADIFMAMTIPIVTIIAFIIVLIADPPN